MAYWSVASRVECTNRPGTGSTGSGERLSQGREPEQPDTGEEHTMKVNRLRHLSGIRFELVQKVRQQIEAGAFDSDAFLDACMDELLADLAG
jgi:hypothetical protein